MPVGRPKQDTPRYGARITTVDPSQGIVRGLMKGDSQERQFSVNTTPISFRWPQVGEAWLVQQRNGDWQLEAPYPDLSNANTPHQVNAGDAIINAPTGVIHVQGSKDGSTDFSFRKEDVTSPPKIGGQLSLTGSLVANVTHNGNQGRMHFAEV